MRTSNPAFGDRVMREASTYTGESATMTAAGTGYKTAFALAILMVAAGFVWNKFNTTAELLGPGAAMRSVQPFMMGGGIVGLVLAFATIFKPQWAKFTTPVYAVAEGLLLGGISAVVAASYPQVNIVFQAFCLTFGTLFTMLVGYQSGWINVSEKFRAGVTAATGGIMLVYIISMGMRFFGMEMPFIHSSGPIGIGFSLFVVVLAALNLVLDFDMIDRMVESRMPKSMEWFGAFALLMTLVWLYIEILRLLAKLQDD